MTPARARFVAVLVAVAGAACGGSDSAQEAQQPAEPAQPPVTSAASAEVSSSVAPTSSVGRSTSRARPTGHRVVDARGVEVEVGSIERVIPLDGDVAEVVFALGMGDHVVATDLSATYPPEADALPQIGYQRALSAEPILEFDPTLLIATDIAGPPETLDQLEQVGVPLVLVPTDPTPTGPAGKIMAVAEALGVPERGRQLAEQVQQEIDAATADQAEMPTPPRIAALYVRGSNAQVVLGEEFAIDWLIEAAGGVNVAGELGIAESAPITAEAMVVASPDILLVPASGLDSVGGVEGLFESVPALAETPAGQAGAVLSYDDQLMLGNGPRTGGFLSVLVDDLRAVFPPEP